MEISTTILKTSYANSTTDVLITCPKHGDFFQNPVNHYRRGDGCPICGYGISRQTWGRTTADFIRDAIKIHGEKYDYSKVKYHTNNKEVVITCPIHGDFVQTPASHLSGRGCPKCAGREVTDTASFVAKANEIHNGKYGYSKVAYTKTAHKVCIICPEHGEFWQIPNSHLSGRGCPRCKAEKQKCLVFGLGINDSSQSSSPKIVSLWYEMLLRCYYPAALAKNPSYIGCSVCTEWLTFSNFEKWVLEQGVEHIGKCQLDKDLLSDGIKQYSPNTCCFLPNRLNTLIRKGRNRTNGLPTGVYKRRNGKYETSYSHHEFSTIEEAQKYYIKAKTQLIQSEAQKAFDNGLISKRAYEALMNFKIA